ncbi:MAG TPA: RodZ domain-containing protein [Candidatus Eremiobacteraceae bacterium]|nr:RodZ domain-containing protein [Candidatus Eremiobacteraceae bacterium]
MAEIGSEFRSAREQLGMTTAQAAQRLHMRAMFVDALEREEWKTVGEPVYVRGFIRNYARLLGLDTEAFVAAFNRSDFAEAPPLDETFEFERPARNRFRYPWLLAGMSALAIFLVLKVVWTMVTPSAAGHSELHAPAATAMVTNAQPALIPGANAAARSQQNGVDLRLDLTQSCWLSVTVDGKRVVYQTLPAGTVKEFHGVREITMRAGNAGGVVATIDGQHIGTLGGPGQVEDRVFAVKTPPIGQDGVHE